LLAAITLLPIQARVFAGGRRTNVGKAREAEPLILTEPLVLVGCTRVKEAQSHAGVLPFLGWKPRQRDTQERSQRIVANARFRPTSQVYLTGSLKLESFTRDEERVFFRARSPTSH